MSEKIRVLIADDEPGMRLILRKIVEREEGFELCGEADNGPELIRQFEQLRPDVCFLDVEMPLDATITTNFNGKSFSHSLRELLQGSRAHFMRGWLSEAIRFNRAAPESAFLAGAFFTDDKPERDTDYYYVRVRQRDGQWAWSSPIWVER